MKVTMRGVKNYVTTLKRARIDAIVNAEQAALEAHLANLKNQGQLSVSEALESLFTGLKIAKDAANKLEAYGYGDYAASVLPNYDEIVGYMAKPFYDRFTRSDDSYLENWRALLEVAKPYELKIKEVKTAHNALLDRIDALDNPVQAVALLKELGFDYEAYITAKSEVSHPTEFDVLKGGSDVKV